MQKYSASKGAFYYVNLGTKATTWAAPALTPGVTLLQDGGGGVTRVDSGGGSGSGGGAGTTNPLKYVRKWSESRKAAYFVNVDTNASVWVLPSGAIVME